MANMQSNFYRLRGQACPSIRAMLDSMRSDRRTTTEIVGQNLRTLMDWKRGLNTPEAVALAARGKLSSRSVRRLLHASHPPGIETLAVLAEIFTISPWQLLYPDLDPQKLPVCVSDDERKLVAGLKAIIAQQEQEPTGNDDTMQDRPATNRPVPVRSKDKDHHN